LNKQKWLSKEIDNWVANGIITDDIANNIMNFYDKKNSANILLIVFSVIGSILIGAGVILISAKNWYNLPIWFRVAIAFFPLVVAQGLSTFVLAKKSDSLPWREGTAIFLSLSIFSSIALVGQIFHLPGDFASYVLICGLLTLPIIYILNATGPVIIYVWTFLNWAGLQNDHSHIVWNYGVFWLVGLIALIAPFIYLKIKSDKFGVRGQILSWVTAIAGFFAVLFINMEFGRYDGHIIASAHCIYFSLIYIYDIFSYNTALSYAIRPFKIVGTIGILVILFIYSYSGIWHFDFKSGLFVNYIAYMILPITMLALTFYMYIKIKKEKIDIIMILSPILLAFAIIIFSIFNLKTGFYPALAVNFIILAVGLFIILKGIKDIEIGYTNFGMLLLCLLIVLRFFDWQMDFLGRGIAFVLLGIGFLTVNLYMVKRRKALEGSL